MIKAIFLDLDGTLLNSQKQILPSSIKALSKCREKDIKLFISTARSPMLDKQLGLSNETLSLFDGGIYCNGAVIKSNRIIDYKYISADIVKNISGIIGNYPNVHLAYHLKNDYHSFNHFLPDEMLMPWGLERNEILNLTEEIFQYTAKLLIYNEYLLGSSKILPDQLYLDIINSSSENANIYLQDNGKSIQISAKNVSKLSAIREIAEKYNLADDEIAVFGDDTNDMEMLANFSNSVAMGNSISQLKETANYTTLSNDNNGIEYALEKILKII